MGSDGPYLKSFKINFITIKLLIFIIITSLLLLNNIVKTFAKEKENPSKQSRSFLSLLIPRKIDTLDSQQLVDTNSLVVVRNIQEGLYEYNMDGNLVPVLAEDFPEKIAPLTYRIKLRAGISFQDGNLLTASDVAFTFKRLFDPSIESLSKELFSDIQSIEAESEFIIMVKLKKEMHNLVELLARHEMYPLSENLVTKYPESYGWITAVGTGPFQFKEWFRGTRVVLTKNKDYWVNRILSSQGLKSLKLFEWNFTDAPFPEFPLIQKLSITIVYDNIRREENMINGVSDIIANPSYADIQNFAQKKKFKIIGKPSTRIIQIYLNKDNYPFNDSKLRKALNMCFNRKKLVKEVFQGYAQPACSPVPPWHWAHNPSLDKTLGYNSKETKNILDSLGYTSDKPLQFTLMYTQEFQFDVLAQWIKKYLQRFPIHVSLKPTSKNVLFDYVYGRNSKNRMEFQAALEDWQDWRHNYDPSQFLYPLYYSSSPENKVKFRNKLVDRLLLLAKNEPRITRKKRIYAQIEKLVANSNSTIVLCVPYTCVIARSDVKGLKLNQLGEIYFRGCR